MKLTKLTQSKKDPNRFYAEFENGEDFSVTVALIADYSLFTGRELDDAEYEALQADAGAIKAKARALRILGKRNMSRREITGRLVEKGESEETAEETADWLERIGAVDDKEYAALIVRHYAARGYGKMRIKDELYRRGIERELWADPLSELPDMDDKAYTVLKSKLGSARPDKAVLKRAGDALYRRGFSWDEIKAAIERYQTELGPDQFTSSEEKDFSDDE